MQGTIFQNAQRIIAQTLEWLQSATNSSIANRIEDIYQNGVCFNELNSMAIVGKDVDTTLTDFFHIEVQTGIAYINGERVALLDSPLLTYNSANPSQTTNDGTGNFVSTPQSTGSYNIPVTAGSINYVYIAYLNTVNTSLFTLNDVTLGKQFYESTDGYQIVVNTTGIAPSASYILLGQVNLTGSNTAISSNISITARPNFQTLPDRIGIVTNNSGVTDRPATYAIGSNVYFLDAHIKSIGTGTVSPYNPHGLSLNDLGVNAYDNTEFHRIHEHQNGIIAGTAANPYPLSSAFYPQVVHVFPGPPDDYVVVQPLTNVIVGTNTVEEVAIVNGVAYTPLEFGAPAGYTLTFTGNPGGIYYIYFNGTGFAFTQTNIIGDETKLYLGMVTWTPGSHGTLSAFVDGRQFGTLNILERWMAPGGRPQNPQPGQVGYDLGTNNLEYYNGSNWAQPVTNLNNSPVPTGALLPFAGASAPTGFLICNGASYSTSAYPVLFGVIGYTYGGSGSTFNVPNMTNLVPVGVGGSIAPSLGNESGATTHTLTVAEIPGNLVVSDPGHSHSAPGHQQGIAVAGGTSGPFLQTVGGGTPYSVNSSTTGITVGGSGLAHPIVQPSIGVNYIIKF